MSPVKYSLLGLSFLGLSLQNQIVIGAQKSTRPNVILLLADDQGYGDIACNGNPYLKTPNLDKLHNESFRLADFHVAPMCSPSRGQLLTGVDCLRNACMATCAGRSAVREEIPMAGEIFANAGYQTGIFGKWHLGYNWPQRPMDRGFQEAVYFNGFGLTGMGHHWNSDYYDPFYYHNGELKQAKGYCNDFWFSEAKRWMKECKASENPFFCYLPTNMAHFPEWIDSSYTAPYKTSGAAGFYGMISNLDENVGKLDQFLVENGMLENTIFIYLSDNGTVHQNVFNAGMTGGKCARTEGGHRVPCFIRWPEGKLAIPYEINTPTQVQDILPTLLELCDIPKPSNAKFDGVSLVNPLKGRELGDRMFVVQYYQLDLKKYDAAIIWNNWRLLPSSGDKLYDIKTDLAQKNNVASAHPDVVKNMKLFYEQWWLGIEPRINEYVNTHIGSSHQSEVVLCSSDWEEVRADGNASARQPKPVFAHGGIWNIMVDQPGNYNIEIRRWPREADAPIVAGLPAFIPRFGTPEPEGMALPIAKAHLTIQNIEKSSVVLQTNKSVIFNLTLGKGKTKLHSWFSDKNDKPLCGVFYAYIKK
jgi:arylsulfatase A-like enzyme